MPEQDRNEPTGTDSATDAVVEPDVVGVTATFVVARTRDGAEHANRLELAPPFVFSA